MDDEKKIMNFRREAGRVHQANSIRSSHDRNSINNHLSSLIKKIALPAAEDAQRTLEDSHHL